MVIISDIVISCNSWAVDNFLWYNMSMYRLEIKPLSLNSAYRGRRFKTPALEKFKKDMTLLLPNQIDIPEGNMSVYFRFGVSSKNSDGDNLVKCAQDIIANYYKFNDKRVYEWHIVKEDTKKGEEFIEFHIYPV